MNSKNLGLKSHYTNCNDLSPIAVDLVKKPIFWAREEFSYLFKVVLEKADLAINMGSKENATHTSRGTRPHAKRLSNKPTSRALQSSTTLERMN